MPKQIPDMSPELEAMLSRPRSAQTNPDLQRKLEAAANRKLRFAGFYKPREIAGVLPAESCGVNGLRPTWHGRAS